MHKTMSEEVKGRCIGCGKKKTIINPTLNLCQTCNDRIINDANRGVGEGQPPTKAINQVKGLGEMGTDLLNIGEKFGINKQDVGKMLLKSLLSGKSPLDFLGTDKSEKKTKFEKVAKAIKEVAWIPLVYIITYQLLQLVILKVG